MTIREALPTDIPQIQIVRNSVKENMLSDPALVPDADVDDYMFRRGKGWVAEENGKIAGFAIADLVDNNIWALFLHPGHEGRGIGRQLHNIMLDWYFSQTGATVWLSTGLNTRAEGFYRKLGWSDAGPYGTKETKFIMTHENWEMLRDNLSVNSRGSSSLQKLACHQR